MPVVVDRPSRETREGYCQGTEISQRISAQVQPVLTFVENRIKCLTFSSVLRLSASKIWFKSMSERTLAHTQSVRQFFSAPCFERRYFTQGVGDSSDNGVFSSHISPRKQESLIQIVGKKILSLMLFEQC